MKMEGGRGAALIFYELSAFTGIRIEWLEYTGLAEDFLAFFGTC